MLCYNKLIQFKQNSEANFENIERTRIKYIHSHNYKKYSTKELVLTCHKPLFFFFFFFYLLSDRQCSETSFLYLFSAAGVAELHNYPYLNWSNPKTIYTWPQYGGRLLRPKLVWTLKTLGPKSST